MKSKALKIVWSVIVTFFIYNLSFGQVSHRYLAYVFPADSIRGFDENMAKQLAFQGGFFGSEYHVYMYRAKRDFIINKYHYTTAPNMNNAKPVPNIINTAPCINEDFEASPSTVGTTTATGVGATLTGWNVGWGQNNGSCTMAGCCPTPVNYDMWVRATPWTAPAITGLGVIPTSPFGGTKVLQMNNEITNQGEVCRISQTFPVTASNALFQFAYMASMDGSGHACCDQPFIRVDLVDCFNNTLACPQVSITPPGPSCATVTAVGWTTVGSISHTPNWIVKAIDLTPYLGTCITIKITVGDCDGWAHFGMAFVDCQCLPMTVMVNNIQFPAGTAVVGVAACGVATATMVAPPGLGPYNWNGPAGSGIINNTNQTVTTTVAGNYTLTMTPPGICAPITRTVNLQFGTFPNAGFTVNNTCTTYTITNTGTGAPSVQTYSFAGAGAPSSYTTTSPTSVINFAPSTTYTIYQTVTNPQNCPATFSMVITTPPGPTPAFTASPSFTQCFTGNAFTFNATTATGTHTYVFSPTAGAPPTGGTANYGPVSFTAPGTYTVIHTVNSGGCVSSTQSVCVINTVPTATATGVPPPCASGQATLTGVGGPGTITWAGPAGWTGTGPTANVNNFQAVNNGIYTMTVNNFGCMTTRTLNLTLGATPTLSVSNTGPYCPGQPITLNFVATPSVTSFSYWSGPGGFFFNPAPTMTVVNNYTTTATANWFFYISWPGGCWAQATTTVQIAPTATATATNTGPYCVGQTIQLNATAAAGATYTWTGPGGFISNLQNPTIPAATATMSGVYTVTVTSGCKVVKTTTVTVNPLPVPVLGSNSPICAGNNLNLTAAGGTSYLWSGPNSFTSAVQNPVITAATAANSGIYTCTLTSAAGCKNTGTISVTVTTPTTSASNTGPYCVGGTIQLNTPTGTTYTWTGPGGVFVSNLQNPTVPTATNAVGGVYNVTVVTAGCQSTASTSVTINPLPVPTIVTNAPVCEGQAITFTGNGGIIYNWSGPASFTSNAQNPGILVSGLTNSGTYNLTVTDANGCINSTSSNVVVNPLPIVTITGATVCANTTINLTSNGGASYSWSGPGGYTSNSQNPIIPNATLGMAGMYSVTVTDANGCVSGANTNVLVNPLPTPTAFNSGPICQGQQVALGATGGINYTWTGPGGFFASTQSTTFTATSFNMSGAYTITASDALGCLGTAVTNLVVNALPNVSIISSANKGCAPLCVTFTCATSPGATCNWAFGDGGSALGINAEQCYKTAGDYTLSASVTDLNGCNNSGTYNTFIYPIPVADFNHAPLKPIINIDPEVTFTDASYNATIAGWNWYFMNNAQYQSTQQNPTFVYTEPGTYAVALVVKSDKGCMDTIVRTIVVGEDYGIYVPNAFTPNGDGINDVFQPKGFGVVKYALRVFDRWGEELFYTEEFSKGWDGTIKGITAKTDVYTWKINATSVFGKAHELSGHVTLYK